MKYSWYLCLGIASLGLRVLGCSASDAGISGEDAAMPNQDTTTGSGTSGGTGGSGGIYPGFTSDSTFGSGGGGGPGGEGMGGGSDPPKGCGNNTTITYQMSSDDSNSMGSPGYAREMLNSKRAPEPALIRTYEFLNYYDMGYAYSKDAKLALTVQALPNTNPQLSSDYWLQVGVKAPPPPSPRRPMALTFVVDTSQSMAGDGLARAKDVVRAIAQSLQDGDIVSVITLDGDATALLDGRTIAAEADRNAVRSVAESLHVGGGSDLQGGLVRGYALAYQHFNEAGMNRLVLITDGRANPTSVDAGFIQENAKQGDEKGIHLVGVGTGPADGYNDALLNKLTEAGRGAYVYIDRTDEAKRIFVDRFSEVMDLAARQVSVSMKLPDYLAVQQYYGEQQSFTTAAIEPQNLGAGDAMIFPMTVRSCLGDLLDASDTIDVTVDWKMPVTLYAATASASVTLADLTGQGAAPIRKANAVVAYAEALKSLDRKRLEGAYCAVKAAYTDGGSTDLELDEIAALMRNHPALSGEPSCSPGVGSPP